MESINPERFSFELHEDFYYDRMNLDLLARTSKKHVWNKIRSIAIGYADAGRIPCLQKSDSVAIMCEDDNGIFWFHYPKISFFMLNV